MKIPFENIDEDLVENKEQKISFIEKALIVSFSGLIKTVLWKVGRAKTYGDLYSIAKFIKVKVESLEGQVEEIDEVPDPKVVVDQIVEGVKEIEEELRGHMGS